MKHAKILAFAVAMLGMTSLHAEGSYLGFALGLHFDLASLGKTIVLDGLDSPTATQPDLRATAAGGTSVNGTQCVAQTAGCAASPLLQPQQVIVPENLLMVRENLSMGFHDVDRSNGGPMIGLVGKIYYERESASNTFMRIGLNHTQRIKGGHTIAKTAGIEWYNVKFDYRSDIIPAYYGIKVGAGETASFYIAGGINYHDGGFKLMGTNLGIIPTTIMNSNPGLATFGPIGTAIGYGSSMGLVPTTQNPAAGLYSDGVFFRTHGIGFNFIIGGEKKLENGDKIFFEFEQIVAGDLAKDNTKTWGGAASFAPAVVYPVNLSGMVYTIGYKMHL